MLTQKISPLLAFLFSHDQKPQLIIDTALTAGFTPIFDLTENDSRPVFEFLAGLELRENPFHLLVSPSAIVEKGSLTSIEKSGVSGIWIQINSCFFKNNLDFFFKKLAELSSRCQCFPIFTQWNLLTTFAEKYPEFPNVVLKGCEASGFVCKESILTLYGATREWFWKKHNKPHFFIWGGVGTGEAAAAFLALGATGIVFESLHCLTDLGGVRKKNRERIFNLRPEFIRLAGESLETPVRVFDKGNSNAVKALNRFVASLNPHKKMTRKQAAFADFFQRESTPLPDGQLDQNTLVPLGVEACFASSFVNRYGCRTEKAIPRFLNEVKILCASAPETLKRFLKSPLVTEMDIQYPFIQGAMTWISDVIEFGEEVADAGGLPTFALGLMDEETLENRLGDLNKRMKGRAYAVNLIALPENPNLKIQLEWLEKIKPPFVVIAAGDPKHIEGIRKHGMEPIYIAPSTDLLKLAFRAGARYAICEGHEAGGHVGELTTLSLAQAVMDLKRREPELFEGRRIILAGGIFNGDTVCQAALLGAHAVQMGTAYLATREIVEQKALSRIYQQMVLSSEIGDTMVTGQTVGLSVRALKTQKTLAISKLENTFRDNTENEKDFRQKLEALTAGSLLIAAHGLEGPGENPKDESFCVAQGQFMCGACAGLLNRIQTIKSLHQDLIQALKSAEFQGAIETDNRQPTTDNSVIKDHKGVLRNPLPFETKPHPVTRDRIAITGFSLVNSLGNTPHDIWQASIAMKSGVTWVPQSRWDHALLYDPRPLKPEKTYCRVGAFKDLAISRKTLGISPQDFDTMTGSTRETLFLAQQAIKHSGITDSSMAPDRIGVMISQNSGECAGTLEDAIVRISAPKILDALKARMSVNTDVAEALTAVLKDKRRAVDDTTLTGRLNATAVGFISNQYGFMGPCHAVTAACASSLAALYNAVWMIRNGVIDAAIVGGGEEALTPLHFLEFSALGALAGLSGKDRPPEDWSRPFDAGRDGFVMGEGGGMLVLERESVAIRRGASIHAFITGIGASNTPTGLVEPSSGAAAIAIKNAFKDGGYYGPREVDLIECHATATIQGDHEEISAIQKVFDKNHCTMISSFKSQIGHTLGAAGISNLIRGIMAMQHQTFPPTLNCEQPDPKLHLDRSNLVICREPDSWKAPANRPRRIQVNAFGFGGFNYVIHVEEAQTDRGNPPVSPIKAAPPLAFVFPGQGTQYVGMGKALYQAFSEIAKWLDYFAGLVDFDLLGLLFNSDETALKDTTVLQPALFSLEYALARQFPALGISPVVMAGHSLGELTALCIAGVFSPKDGFQLARKRGQCMARAAQMAETESTMTAVHAPLDRLEPLINEQKDAFICNINSSKEVVLGGTTRAMNRIEQRLKTLGFPYQRLNVSMAFHSPLMGCIQHEFENILRSITFNPPGIPVLSNVTGKPYPSSVQDIRKLLGAHLTSPVRWAKCVETLCESQQTTHFVEIGPGHVLSRLMEKGCHCLPTCLPGRETETFRNCLAKLSVNGHFSTPETVSPLDPLADFNGTAEPETRASREKRRTSVRAASRRDFSRLEAAPAIVEALIEIVMDATGYDRDEIEPDMDLKDELAIRSSRLPLIMDAAERRFGITIQIEDFLEVRTVRDAALKIAGIIETDGVVSPRIGHSGKDSKLPEKRPLQAQNVLTRRFSFREMSLKPGRLHPMEIKYGAHVAVWSAGRPGQISKKLKEIFAEQHGLQTTFFSYVKKASDFATSGFDIRTSQGTAGSVKKLEEMPSLVGLVIVLDDILYKRIETMEDVSRLLCGLFLILKCFAESSHKKFVFLVQTDSDRNGTGNILSQGILGMYLSATLEYGSIQFRTLHLDRETDLSYAIRCAMDKSRPIIENIYHGGEAFSKTGYENPLEIANESGWTITSEDVIVLSGGGRGITAHLAKALAPFGPRTVLLGRTEYDPDSAVADASKPAENLTADQIKCLEIKATLQAAGPRAVYVPCHVEDKTQVQEVMASISRRYGDITGIIHGAGILKDALMTNLSPADFKQVLDVKFLGAWHLFRSAKSPGLKFFMGISSVAAVHGSPGQINYACGNRALMGMITELSRKYAHIRFKSLILPPISGAGMAEKEEVRQVMGLRGLKDAYVPLNELKELFCRELLIWDTKDVDVMFSRKLPSLKGAGLDSSGPAKVPEEITVGPERFKKSYFPMVENVSYLNITAGDLKAERIFSRKKDLWISDHKPFKALKHPMISSIMALEAFMEAAKLLYPYLHIRGIHNARFMELVECPPGIDRKTEIRCRRIDREDSDVICEISLSSQDISPTGRAISRMTRNFEAQVRLSGEPTMKLNTADVLSVTTGELDTEPIDAEGLEEWYEERSDFNGRYRLLTHVAGTGENVISGKTICRMPPDFSDFSRNHYQYFPYLLEAIFHLVASHAAIRDRSQEISVIPVEINTFIFGRPPLQEEEITMVCRKAESGSRWNAESVDSKGRSVMKVQGIRMHQLSL